MSTTLAGFIWATHRIGTRSGGEDILALGISADEGVPGVCRAASPGWVGRMQPGGLLVCGPAGLPVAGAIGALALPLPARTLASMGASSTVTMVRPRDVRMTVDGILRPTTSAVELARHLTRKLEPDALRGAVVEFDGEAIVALTVPDRAVLCAAVRRAGALGGIVAPDAEVDRYLGRVPPRADEPDQELLVSTPGARFDVEIYANATTAGPHAA